MTPQPIDMEVTTNAGNTTKHVSSK
ncbi:uncharacterized protein FMAN_10595 [Fusarium mangiferae]|uniref:Uncharacterized protein n=1 Tax=Fusarium mangiferae TaxID=192010 RepID=A0A1L7U4H9_FUSMA|nr:uncharacterized protein FMAN_10595 [Fusarium mangiferae]